MSTNNSIEVGGNVQAIETSDAIKKIASNRTLMALKLTSDMPVTPKVVEGLKTTDAVFEHYKPNVDVSFKDLDGGIKNENISFENITNFGIKGLTAKSSFLNSLSIEQQQYQAIIKQLKTNKVLQMALKDNDAKDDFVSQLKGLITELENNNE